MSPYIVNAGLRGSYCNIFFVGILSSSVFGYYSKYHCCIFEPNNKFFLHNIYLYTQVSLYPTTQIAMAPHTDMIFFALASEHANSSVSKDPEGYSDVVHSLTEEILIEHLA